MPLPSLVDGEDGDLVERYHDAMRHVPTGVAVVTSTGPAGPVAMTANSLVSIALEPPLLAISLLTTSRTALAVRHCSRFAVNLLGANQAAVAADFARPGLRRDLDHLPRLHGVPVGVGDVGTIVCEVASRMVIADHDLVVGHVVEVCIDGGEPLVLHRGLLRGLS